VGIQAGKRELLLNGASAWGRGRGVAKRWIVPRSVSKQSRSKNKGEKLAGGPKMGKPAGRDRNPDKPKGGSKPKMGQKTGAS